MDQDWQELESVRRKCEELDGELDTFFKALKEIKEIRDSVSNLPEKLRQDVQDIEVRKKEIEDIMSSASNMLITFEEQARGLFFDMEKKTESLAGEVKSGMSYFRNMFELNSSKLSSEQKERLEHVMTAYEQIRSSHEEIRNMLDSHGQAIDALKKNHAELLKLSGVIDPSLKGIQKSLAELQKRPQEIESKLKAMEEKLKDQFFTKLDRQKYIVLAMLGILTAGIIFFVFYPQ